jgi:hypothetical protein
MDDGATRLASAKAIVAEIPHETMTSHKLRAGCVKYESSPGPVHLRRGDALMQVLGMMLSSLRGEQRLGPAQINRNQPRYALFNHRYAE